MPTSTLPRQQPANWRGTQRGQVTAERCDDEDHIQSVSAGASPGRTRDEGRGTRDGAARRIQRPARCVNAEGGSADGTIAGLALQPPAPLKVWMSCFGCRAPGG